MDDEANLDPYLQLGLDPTATEKDIKSAYRKKSLKCHPDRNPDNPEAAHQFHLLSLSQALLLDGPKRAALDVKLEASRKRAEKMAGLESRKRELVQDLVAKEEAFKRSKLDFAAQSHQKAQEAAVQSEGRKLREAAEAARLASLDEALRDKRRAETDKIKASKGKEKASSAAGPEVEEIDRTLKLTLPLPRYSTSTTSASSLTTFLSTPYGALSHVVLLQPKPSKKPSVEGAEQISAMVVFPLDNLAGCWALLEDCKKGKKKGWEGVKAKWGKGSEPEWVGRLGSSLSTASTPTGKDERSIPSAPASTPSFSFDPQPVPSFGFALTNPPPSGDYENATLLRMRQAERERLEKEIRDAEGDD